jgi:hypothetical protein
MEHAAASPLLAWENFYVIVGSSAAALTGLQFVVIVLVAEVRGVGNVPTTRAFGTPTVVHFCAVLLISAVLSAPWPTLSSVSLVLGVSGVAGTVYAGIVTRRALRQKDYVPVLEDWIWHSALPLAGYAALFLAAIMLGRNPARSLFAIGGTALLLLFIGIHNAWDSVVYIALRGSEQHEAAADERKR